MIAVKTGTKLRRTIGLDPLDSILPASPVAEPAAISIAEPKARPRKIRATFHIPTDLYEEARDAAVALSGPPVRLTLAAFAESAIRNELARLKELHNGGESFPARSCELRGGRPIGS